MRRSNLDVKWAGAAAQQFPWPDLASFMAAHFQLMSRVDEQPSLGRQHLQRSLPVPAAHAGAGGEFGERSSCIFGVAVAVSCRALAVPAALSRALCWAKCKGPESLPLVGIFIPMATTVGRRTLIIHLCTLNFNRGKQTVLQISSPEVWTSALFSWEHGKVLENQVLFQSLNPQASQVQYLLCQTP